MITSKAQSLIVEFVRATLEAERCTQGDYSLARAVLLKADAALVAYIEELERKAEAYDAMKASLAKFDELFPRATDPSERDPERNE